jgi:hypothetical protein
LFCVCLAAVSAGCAGILGIDDIPTPDDGGESVDVGARVDDVTAPASDVSKTEASNDERDPYEVDVAIDASHEGISAKDASSDQLPRPVPEASADVQPRDVRLVSDGPRLEGGLDGGCEGAGCASCLASVSCPPANACHTGLTTCSPAPACIDTGTSIPDGIACGSTASCQGGRCTCGASNGTTPAFVSCSSSTSCQPGFLCVDNNGDGVFFCKPACSTNADCAPYQASLPTLRCAAAACFNGRTPGIFACNDNPGRLHSSYDVTSCCGGGDAGPVSDIGCSDGTREGFVDRTMFPTLAGCGALWPESSMRSPKDGVPCGNSLGTCAVPADACAAGWHVCATPPYGPADVSSKITAAECAAQPGEFAMAVGDQRCEPCDITGDGAACCGMICVQQNGSCVFPGETAWFGVIDGHDNRCSDIVASYLGFQGVLCCRGF